jgi:hypothetical protein
MLSAGSVLPEDRWDRLQQPTHPSEVEPQYRLLLAALDLGWHIEEPVYLRPRWSDSGPRVYHFILRRSLLGPPKLITVPEGVEIDRYVRGEALCLVIGH